MAAAEHPLARALAGLCACLGRSSAPPRTPENCAELLQALVLWAAPGPEPGTDKEVPARAAAAVRASLLLLEAVSAASRGGGHVTGAGAAKAGQGLQPQNAEESGKCGAPTLLLEDRVEGDGAPHNGEAPKSSEEGGNAPVTPECAGNKGEDPTDVALKPPTNSAGAPVSTEKIDVAPESRTESGGAPISAENMDVAPKSLGNSGGAPISAEKIDVAPESIIESGGAPVSAENMDVAPESFGNSGGAPISAKKIDVAPESQEEAEVTSVLDPESGILAPRCVLRWATAPLLLLCGAHIQDALWSDAQSRRLANQLLRSLLEAARCTSVAELLKGPREEPYHTYREALGLLGPRLRKDTWESHPEAKVVFSWMLQQVPRPWLADFLSRVMPPSLLFSDDYKPENKVLGIQCLHHIIKNVAAAELRQYNRALVVYHALRNHLHTTDAEVIEVVLPCLLDLFPVLHQPPPVVGTYQKEAENPSDQVMQQVLTHMEMEHKIVLRRLYARNLPALQERLGFRIARHMKRLLRVIVGYLEVCDGPEETARLCILETLQGTIKYAWPRIPPRLPLLLKALVKLIYELSSETNQNSAAVTEALLNGASECLLLLDNSCKGQVRTALQDLPSVCNEPLLLKCIHRVLQNT